MVLVSFQLICGESEEREVPQDIHASDLYDIAGKSFGGTRDWVQLAIGAKIIAPDQRLPLAKVKSDPVTVVVVWNPESFFDVIRRGSWSTARSYIENNPRPHLIAGARDRRGDTVLSWVAYCAAKHPCPDAFQLVRAVLSIVPADASYASPESGFLPLHEAAWGNAPLELAMLLCCAYPRAAGARTPRGESPYDVGMYHHGKNFRWAPPELMHRQALAVLRGEPMETVAVERQPEAPVAACSSSDPRASVHSAASVKIAKAEHRRSRRQPSNEDAMGLEGEVEYIREASVKESGAYAGAGRVRNCRCDFTEVAKITICGRRDSFFLRMRGARTVHKAVQRPAGKPKWPSKKDLQKDRKLDRNLKLEMMPQFGVC